ncbi:urea ABC transporter permease subunit UrtB [uncultured Thiodictyon sp.]|uniref:urea ABC transporter permease subunit UrtB n=1 Tax=uncultured Thiodictyon sp. TaxID=1846217 RepID=UPI0025CCA250|nr:urea ABC transporter permease subunit UrtB [uncultured Thiodictyon sp.]
MPRSHCRISRAITAIALLGLLWLGAAAADTLEDALPGLADRALPVKKQAVAAIVAAGEVRALPILEGLLVGDLYAREGDPPVVLVRSAGSVVRSIHPITGADLGEVDRASIKKITLTNALRTELRGAIAALSLGSPDPQVRLHSARALMQDPNPAAVAALRARLGQERDTRVRATLDLAMAVADLQVGTAESQRAAIAHLDGSLYPEARNALATLLATDALDPAVAVAARQALAGIDARVAWNARAETLFFGLSLGSVLVLAAIGLAITFGVMGVINMAHGELMMLGAYTTYLVQQAMPGLLDYSLFIAIPAAFIVAGLFGVAIERTVIRFLYGRPLETLLATFGISLILQQLVRTTVSAQNVTVENPSWMSGSWQLNPGLALTFNRLYILVFAMLVFLALLLILKRTALGLQVRAVSQNRAMARAMGVRSARVDALTFGLGAGIAGVAGVALSQLTNVGPNMGQAYIIDSFMVVVFGGVGNLWGTLIGGTVLGVANKFMEPWAGAVLAKILVLVFIILFIQKRPRGLFPQRGRAAEG